MSIRNLDRLLQPRSIAVIGVSNRVGSVGATVWANLSAGPFAGKVYGVNPKYTVLEDVAIFSQAADLPEVPDLAVICTPPASVAGLIEELGRLGTRAAIVMSAGLNLVQKEAMLKAARPHLLRILGPNCLGILSPHVGLNASFAHANALPGEVAFVSQSGALVTAVLDWARSRRIGFSHMVSLGERADVDFGDLLDYLASDARTRSILLYIESIEAPRKFMSAARAAARNKPVIVVKAGRAGNGLKAAASHTGALAGSDLVFDAAIRRAGMLRVETLQDLFMATETLARFGSNRDEALTLMTNGGGAGVMGADAAALAGIALNDLSDELLASLNAVLPPTWSRGNPIDIIGDAPVSRYTQTLQAVLADRSSGAVLFMHAPTAIVRSDDIARACEPIARGAPGRVMACWLGDESVADARRIFTDAGIPDYATPEEAVRAFGLLGTYRRNQALLLEAPTANENGPADVTAARAIIEGALAAGRDMLDELEAKAVLGAYGIPVVPTVAIEPTADAAVKAARDIGYPVAIKILSPDISHKSDVGGVHLHLRGEEALRKAADGMLARVRELKPQARITGLTVQAMVTRPLAQELILGTSIDPLFGPVLLFGQGGTAVEVLADRAIGLPPLNRVLARELISRTRVAKLLAGYRDHPPAKLDAICDVLVALSQMLADLPELAELDINPLLADHEGVIALDARLRVSRKQEAGAAHFAITPYPAELVQTVPWNDETILIRPIRPEDEPQHRSFIEALQPEDLRLRFFNVRRELPKSELARLTQIDYAREMAFIAVRNLPNGTSQTLGVVRAVIDPDNVDAEFAVIVRSDLKARGLGRILMRKMIAFLKGRQTQRMAGYVLRENQAMRKLARSLGFEPVAASTDTDAVFFALNLEPPKGFHMQALVYHGPGQKKLDDRAKPVVKDPTDAVVRITKTTICGTDLHILKGDVATCKPGTTLGHEGVGVIDSVGPGVVTFKPGDRVLISCISACGRCEYCRKGMYSHCTTGGWILGNTIDGTQAEFVRIPHADTSLYPIPDGADEEALVMLSDILPTGFECGVLNGRVQPGSTVAIVGSGPIGLAALLTAQLYSPAEIIMIDLDENRLAVGKRFGATATVNSADGTAAQQVMALTGGRGVDTAIEAVGIPATFTLCEDIVAAGGTIANVGVHGVKADLHLERLWSHNITITTRLVDTVSMPMLLKTVQSKRIDAKQLITHHFKLSEILQAYDTFSRAADTKALKVIIEA